MNTPSGTPQDGEPKQPQEGGQSTGGGFSVASSAGGFTSPRSKAKVKKGDCEFYSEDSPDTLTPTLNDTIHGELEAEEKGKLIKHAEEKFEKDYEEVLKLTKKKCQLELETLREKTEGFLELLHYLDVLVQICWNWNKKKYRDHGEVNHLYVLLW